MDQGKTNIGPGLALPTQHLHQFSLDPGQTPQRGSLHSHQLIDYFTMRVSVVIVVMCVTLSCADVKPQKDFNISRVREQHMSLSVFVCHFPGRKCTSIGTLTG